MKREEYRLWRRAWAALPLFLGILVLAGAATTGSASSALSDAALAGLIGGSGGGPWCGFGTGLAMSLGLVGSLALLGGATAPVGAGLTIAGAVVGGITYLAC